MKVTPRELRLLATASREAYIKSKADRLLTRAELHKLREDADKAYDDWLDAIIELLTEGSAHAS